MTRSGKALVAGAVVLAPVVAAAVFVKMSVISCPGPKSWIDSRKLRKIVARPASTRELPMKDGAFDPYELLRKGIVGPDCFQSDRSATGPTDAEIARGDYTNFPWERYRGDGSLRGPAVFALLWEKTPDSVGKGLVALSDGSVEFCQHEELLARLLVGLVAQSGRMPMMDGAFDPYQFVREGRISACFLRPPSEASPTDAEIERGDYANFPWERYRGDGKLDGPPVPLLVAKVRDYDGDIIVGLSDGTITCSDVMPER